MRSLKAMDPHAARKFVNTMAASRGLTVKYHNKPVQPHTDPVSKVINVTKPAGHWSDFQSSVWMGEICHELGHHRGVNADIMEYFTKQGVNMRSLYGTCVNMFADVVNDKQWAGKFDGTHLDVQAAQLYHGNEGLKSVQAKPPADDKSRLLCELFSWYYQRKAETFQPALRTIASGWEKAIPVPGTLRDLDTDFDGLHDAESIENLIRKILPPEEIEKGKEPQEGQGKGGKGKSGKSDKGEKGEKAEGKGSKPGKGEGDESEEEAWVRYRDLLPDDHDGEAKGKKGINIIYDHEPQYGTYIWSEGYDEHSNLTPNVYERESYSYYETAMREAAAHNRGLAGSVARLIQIRSEKGMVYNQKSGRLSGRHLTKVPMGNVEVFKRTTDPIITKDCAIEILGDMSGSMMGEKFAALGASFILLNEACSKVGIPFELTMFTERGGRPQYHVVKAFNGRTTTDKICEYFVAASPKMGHNADGEALLWAHNRLAVRNEKKKILIVLSDGQPATGRACGDCFAHLKEVTAAIEKKVVLIGVGLLSNSVEHFYTNRHVVSDVEDLESMFLDLLKSNVI